MYMAPLFTVVVYCWGGKTTFVMAYDIIVALKIEPTLTLLQYV